MNNADESPYLPGRGGPWLTYQSLPRMEERVQEVVNDSNEREDVVCSNGWSLKGVGLLPCLSKEL